MRGSAGQGAARGGVGAGEGGGGGGEGEGEEDLFVCTFGWEKGEGERCKTIDVGLIRWLGHSHNLAAMAVARLVSPAISSLDTLSEFKVETRRVADVVGCDCCER